MSAQPVVGLKLRRASTEATSSARRLSGGSDGSRLREIDVVAPPLVPFLYPERLLKARQRRGIGRYSAVAKGPRIPEDRWLEVAARARREGLRAVARDLGVSPETVRAVLLSVQPSQVDGSAPAAPHRASPAVQSG